jgi:foldase protein PrsA
MKSYRLIANALAMAVLTGALVPVLVGCENGNDLADKPATDANRAQPPRNPLLLPDPNQPEDPNGAVMAYVNGKPVPMARLHRILVQSDGLPLAMQLVVNELVRQEADRHEITVSEKDIRREANETIARGFGGQDLTPDQRDALLDQYLQQSGISRVRWDLTMKRNALLGKLLARSVDVSDEQLRDEFHRRFGRQVVVRHIEVSSLTDAQDVLKEIKAGKDFAKLAYEHSINPSAKDGGLLPAISAKTVGVPPAMRSVAVSMSEAGEVSDPVQITNTFHILKLEKVIPPKDVEFEDKKDQLRQTVRSRVINQQKQIYLRQLYAKALEEGRIRLVNPTLKKQFEKRSQQTPPR